MGSRLNRWRAIRSSEAGEFLETFLVSAVAAVLTLRWSLALAGYPSLGGNGLHIAHMLWGGLLMLIATILLLVFVDRRAQRTAATVSGVGFGIFIDEIGKFLTADNNYFFRPAIALIYVILVAVFLVMRAVLTTSNLDQRQSLANAMDLLEDGLDGTIDDATRTRVARLLGQSEQSTLANALSVWLASLAPRPEAPGWRTRLRKRVDGMYDGAVANPLFERAVLTLMGLYALLSLGSVATLAATQDVPGDEASIAQTLATLAGSLLVARGLLALPRSRRAAYRWFRRGIVVWLLVAQVFVFYTSQLAGVGGLAADLVAYVIVRYMLAREVTTGAQPDVPAHASTRAYLTPPGRHET